MASNNRVIAWAALGLLCATLGCSGKGDAAATKSAANGSAAESAPAKPEAAPAPRLAAAPATDPARELTLDLGGALALLRRRSASS